MVNVFTMNGKCVIRPLNNNRLCCFS